LPQLWVPAGTQLPVPLQVGTSVSSAAVQLRDPQGVAGGNSWQPPVPSHLPVRPQLAAGSAVQPVARGSALLGRSRQEPAAPTTLHDRQAPLQSPVSQQTPSMQWVDWHSLPLLQAVPSGFLPHEPLMHGMPGAQSAELPQLVWHAPAAQANGAHDWVAGVSQLPLPSQVAGSVRWSPTCSTSETKR
jgi:hypothetical protein